MGKNKVVFVVGPTAVGKSSAALILADYIDGEIISCDSMQVYREINIANDKPAKQTIKKIPHHLINVVSVSQEFDVVQYNRLAVNAIKNVHSRERIPIVVGGSGLYVKVLLDGIFDGVSRDDELRTRLERQAAKMGNLYLHDQLKALDTQAAAKIHSNDTKRIIRALEVCLTENKPISSLQQQTKGIWGQYDISLFCLNRPRKEIYQLIEERIDKMFECGIVDEINSVKDLNLSRTARSIIGVKEISAYLNGDYDIERAKYLMKLHSRHLAKRQLTWFRREDRLKWVDVSSFDSPRATAGYLNSLLGAAIG